MTDEMYARIREVADEHGGRMYVCIAHPDLTAPVIARPRPLRHPEVYMTEEDLDDFRDRIRAEGLKPQRQSEVRTARTADFLDGSRFADAYEGTVAPSTADYGRYLDCVYAGQHLLYMRTPCPFCGCHEREFDAKAVWR